MTHPRDTSLQYGNEGLWLVLVVSAFAALAGILATAAAADSGRTPEPHRQIVERNGIKIDFEVAHTGASPEQQRSFQEGDPVVFRFAIRDTTTSAPIQGGAPAAWLDLRRSDEIPAANSCEIKARKFITGGLFAQAELDLNDYYVLTLNDDATISVVDPLFGFGTTKLLALIPLPANGYDWVLTKDQAKLFVSIPEKGQIAVIDTATWEVSKYLEADMKPNRLALQPDDQYLWVAGGGSSQSSLAAFRTGRLELAAQPRIGNGRHEIVATADSRFVFVTNGEDNSVSVVDTGTLKVVKEIAVGKGPVTAAYSDLANAVYIAQTGAGSIAVIDAKSLSVVRTIQADPGLAEIAVAPGGRYLFVLNRQKDLVQIIDSSVNEIVQSGTVGKAPFQISFTKDFAYINHLDSTDVYMVSLDQVGRKGVPLTVVTFPGGQQSLGGTGINSPAARVVQASGENAVLVANAPDKQVYYYKEGMAAPMGSFSNYGRQPMATQVVDRSLRERASPGVYQTVAKLPKPGLYDVVFFLDSPRLVVCFAFTVDPNPAIEAERNAGSAAVTALAPQTSPKLGEKLTFKFRIVDLASKQPVNGLTDVVIVTFLAPGTWHRRDLAKEEGEGVYSIAFNPPQAGVYYGHVQCSSVHLPFGNPNYITVRVLPTESLKMGYETPAKTEKLGERR
jgi:YVTN family beta-propeller protein